MTRAALLWCSSLAACGAPPHSAPANIAPDESVLMLYRDRAVVAQRVEIDVPPGGRAAVKVKVAAGAAADDVFVLDRGELTVDQLHTATNLGKPGRGTGDDDDDDDPAPSKPSEDRPAAPSDVELAITAPRAGRYVIRLGYATDRIAWDAAYTMTTTATRDRATLRGALAIRNTSGIELRSARVSVIDAEIGAASAKVTERLANHAVGADSSGTAHDDNATPAAVTRTLGRYDIADGDTRIELLGGAPSRPMRSILVFDPIGTKLDHASRSPSREADLGVRPAPSTRVTESFEITRDTALTAGLPAGPVRLLERRADGTLAVIGESKLFDAATRVADVDTIAVGTAEGVTGSRERREMTIDDDNKRFAEDFVIAIANTRSAPVEIVLREHLYRGQNWTLAYFDGATAKKEGPQEISLRTTVPAKGTTRVLYVVVYTW